MPEHLIFDLDGTLVDSASVIAFVLNEMRFESSLPPLESLQFAKWISLGADLLVSNALELEHSAVEKPLADFRHRYAQLPTPVDSVYPGVHGVLRRVSGLGVRLSVCTNKPRRLAEKVLLETGLSEFFPFVCAGGDLASPKPDPANLFACVTYFKTPISRTYLVGDSRTDQVCAKNADMGFIFHSKGYDDGVDVSTTIASFEDYHSFNSLF